PDIDRLAFDVLQHEIRLPGGDAGVDEMSDVRMREFGERIRFVPQALATALTERPEIEKLDRRLSFVTTVAAPGQPHTAHAALAKRPIERVAAEAAAGELGETERIDRAVFEEALAAHRCLMREQPGDVIAQRRVLRTNLREPHGPRSFI